MIADLKPYAEYKESGLPWLGKVPVHWDIRRAKFVLREIDSRSTEGREQLLRVSQYTGVTIRKSLDGSQTPYTRAASLIGYKRVHPNDLVINIMLAWNGSMGVSRYGGIASPAYCVYRFNKGTSPWYFHELLRTPAYKQRIKTASTGVVDSRLRLYSDDLGRIKLPIPPLVEQAAIVRFLDWANGRLERAIRAKRRVIALLNEQKQAIIHRAVTRGLDPNVPLKPSGMPWLGEIPQHWQLKRFKFLVRINSGQVDPRKTEYRDQLLIAPNHIESGTGRLLNLQTAHEQGADSGKYSVTHGQVIYSKIRPNLRKASIAPTDCLCSADMYPMMPLTKDLSTDYLLLLLLSQPFTKFAVDTSMRVAMPKVNRESLANCRLWYPDTAEQSSILEFIRCESKPLDSAVSRLEREIDLLREYRTRLVADVVTGKLDVREAATRLPNDEPLLDSADTEDTDTDTADDLSADDETDA
jgi:type I restriction enzyme S subunit